MKEKNFRKSYILFYCDGDVRYVFNRSVSWYTYIPKKYHNVLEIIGYEIVSNKIDKFVEEHALICRNIDNIENYLKTHNTNCAIIETLEDKPNYNLSDQKYINDIKKQYCMVLDAVDRKTCYLIVMMF